MTRPEIETARLRLRGWRPEDHAPFAALCADPDVMRHIGSGATRSPEEAARAIRSFERGWTTRGYGLFAVAHKRSGPGFGSPSIVKDLPIILPVWKNIFNASCGL